MKKFHYNWKNIVFIIFISISILLGVGIKISGIDITLFNFNFFQPQNREEIKKEIDQLLESKFKDYILSLPCKNFEKPIIKNGTLFLSRCSFLYRSFSFEENGYFIGLGFQSSWFNSRNELHYLLDIGKNEEKNRISLYEENNYLKFRIYTENNSEYTLKLNLKDVEWKDEKLSDKFNIIRIGWDKNSGHIFLSINDVQITLDLSKLDLDISDSQMFIGTDLNNEFFAEGYYDFIMIGKYSFPEPTCILREEESLK